jgi:hypothetical protein
MVLWIIYLHQKLSSLNLKKESLFMLFLQMSEEIKDKKNYRYVGLSKIKSLEFWRKNSTFMTTYMRIYNISMIIPNIIYNIQVFNNNFKLNIWIYLLVVFINISWNFYWLYLFCHFIYTLSVLFESIVFFLNKKYLNINKKLKLFFKNENYQIDNVKLAKLIFSYEYVSNELIHINEYFKYFNGINMFFFIITFSIATFVILIVDLTYAIVFSILISIAYIFLISIPYYFSSQVIKNVSFL